MTVDPKLPPQNIEAEQSILGGLLLDREAWDQISDVITSEDFYRPSHQKLFASIAMLTKNSKEVDIITVTEYLKSIGDFEFIGHDYLIQLLQNTLTTANISSYAKIVKEKSLLRKLISCCSQITQKAYEQNFENIETFIDNVEADIFKIGESRESAGLVEASNIVFKSIENIEKLYHQQDDITGISTGFSKLDQMTAGLHPGELTILAARPSMGKTALSLNIAQNVALRQKKTVAYFSVEMSKESVMMRLLAAEAKINLSEVRSGKIADQAWPKLVAAASTMSEAPLFIDDTSGISPFEIRARARRLKKQHGLDLIIIDYLQLMDLKQKVESRERAVSEISRTLKAIAKELQVPIMALAQLNRAVEGRAEKKPMLSDLRESGSIEQDADVIMMLFREGYYDRNDESKFDRAEVIIGKQRNGPTGSVDLKWEPKFGRFTDTDEIPSSPLPPPPPQPIQYTNKKPKNYAPGSQAPR
jgi:replicative DNA helicase